MSKINIYSFLCLFLFIGTYADERKWDMFHPSGDNVIQLSASTVAVSGIEEADDKPPQTSFLRLSTMHVNPDEERFHHYGRQYSVLVKKNRQNFVWGLIMTIVVLIFAMIVVKVSLINRRLNHIHVKYIEQHQRLREWLKELKKCERRTRKRLREIEEQMKRQQMENEVVYEPILSKFHHSGEWRPTEEDWKALAQIIDKTYNGFTYRLKVTALSLEERDIRACLLLKIGVRRKNMAPLLFMTESGVSMHHVRLYKKITGQKTKSSISLRDFIRDF